jgi:CysZ protein
MLADLIRAIRQLPAPGMRGWVAVGVLVAVAVLVILVAAVQLATGWLTDTGYGWLDWTIRLLGALGSLVAAWFLFPATVTLVFGLIIDRIVDVVERLHYPGLPPPRSAGLREGIGGAVRLGVLAVGLNLLAIPLYLVPGVNIAVALLLNGYLIGREYFEAVALRRMDPPQVQALRRQHGGAILLAGITVALLLLIPLVNLVAPVLGAAFLTHRFHSLSLRT